MNRLAKLPGGPLVDDMEPVSQLPSRVPLPGVANPDAVTRRLLVDREPGARLDALTARHLATHYGSLAFEIARLASADPSLGERVHPDGPEIWAQVRYARGHEWAQTVQDVLRRRTTLSVRGLGTPEVAARVQEVLDAR